MRPLLAALALAAGLGLATGPARALVVPFKIFDPDLGTIGLPPTGAHYYRSVEQVTPGPTTTVITFTTTIDGFFAYFGNPIPPFSDLIATLMSTEGLFLDFTQPGETWNAIGPGSYSLFLGYTALESGTEYQVFGVSRSIIDPFPEVQVTPLPGALGLMTAGLLTLGPVLLRARRRS
jgi:hypothetical protein